MEKDCLPQAAPAVANMSTVIPAGAPDLFATGADNASIPGLAAPLPGLHGNVDRTALDRTAATQRSGA